MRPGTTAVFAALAAVAAGGFSAAAEEPAVEAGLHAACVKELPKALAEAEAAAGDAAKESAPHGAGDAGSWSTVLHDLDGDGVNEAFLIALPAGRPGEVTFLHRRDGAAAGEWQARRVELEGGPALEISVHVQPLGNGRSLAWVNAGPGGQALLSWSGGKLDTVWKVGKPREGERRWFVLEDLDENGVDEVVEYFQREMDDFYADEDDLEDDAAGGATTRIDAVAVHRLEGDRWKKDRDLLESRRKR